MATPLLERTTELAAVDDALARVRSGAGRLILLEGAAGVGKSTLIEAASVRAAAQGVRVLRARGGELERDFAFGAVRQLIEPVLAAATATAREDLLSGSATAARGIFGPPGEPAGVDFAVMDALYWLLAGVGDGAPLLVAVDDLHWVDALSLRYLDFVARRLDELPVLLLGALRPAEPGAHAELLDGLRDHPGALHLTPPTLSPEAVTAIVRAERPGADAQLCSALHAASVGNPLYLRELLRSGATSPGQVHDASLPAVGDRLERRIGRVSPQAMALATSMAVLGDGGSLRSAAVLAGLDFDLASTVARKLRRIEVLADEDPVVFVHPVVRRSIYDRQSSAERIASHGAAARQLTQTGGTLDAIAAHLSMLPPAGSQVVAAQLRAAALDALGRAAPSIAITRLQRALDEGATSPNAAELLFELGQAQMAIRDPAAIATLQAARAQATASWLVVRIAATLTDLLAAVGQWTAAIHVLAEARATLTADDSALIAELESCRAVLSAFDPALVAEYDRDYAHFARIAAGDTWAARATSALLAGVGSCRGEGDETLAPLLDHALEGNRLLSERGAGAWASIQAVDALVNREHYPRAVALAADIEAAGRHSGSMIGVISGICYRGVVHARRGNLLAAEADLRAGMQIAVQAQMAMWMTSFLLIYVDVLIERPQLADLVQQAQEIELPPSFAATASGAMLMETRGRLALARDDRAEAARALRAASAVYTPLQFGPARSPWLSELALAVLPEDPDEALRLVTLELGLAREVGLARPQGIALRAAGIVAGGSPGIELLRESLACLTDSPSRLELARTQVALGAALRRAHQRTAARDLLAAGLDLAHRCGAERLMARAHDELRAAGARPRRPSSTGADALTASERRTARLAAEGRSNLEIAQALYIGLKTVETHLSHAYAKLGLSGQGSRQRLNDALSEGSAIPSPASDPATSGCPAAAPTDA